MKLTTTTGNIVESFIQLLQN